MEDLTLPAGVTWTTGLGLRGTPGWGVNPPRRGQTPHPRGLWVLPRGGRPRRGGSVPAFPVSRIPPGGVLPRCLGNPRVGNWFPGGVTPSPHPGRPGGDALALTRGATPVGRWAYLFGRGGRFVSPRWGRTPPGRFSKIYRGRPYQLGYLVGLSGLWGGLTESSPRGLLNRVSSRGVPRGTRLSNPRGVNSPPRGIRLTSSGGAISSVRDWSFSPPRDPRGRKTSSGTIRGFKNSPPVDFHGGRLSFFSILGYHKKAKTNYFVRRPRRWRRKGTGKLARRYRTFGGDLRRRWRWFARPPGWRPRRKRRRWLRRRRKWLERKTYRQLRRNRRGRPRRGPPRRGGLFGFARRVRWSTGVKRFRRLRRLRRRVGLRGKLWTPRGVRRVQKNFYHRRRTPRGGSLVVRLRSSRGDPRRSRFWRFRSPRRRVRRRWPPRGKIHLREGRGVPSQFKWWNTPESTPHREVTSRWGGKFISRGTPREGLTRKILRGHPSGVFQRTTWLLGVGLGHHPRTRAGTLQRVASLGTPRGTASLVRKWLTKAISTRGDRTWAARVTSEVVYPTRAIRSREDYLKVAVAGGALL